MSGSPLTHFPPMRDGTELAADVYLPDAERPVPALLVRTPYGRRRLEGIVYGHPALYTARGYAVVCQDVRGRGDSGGVFRPFEQEGPDGYDSVEWIAEQPWCDGRVGMYGFSYPGFAQLAAAAQRPPHLRAITPAMTAADVGEEWIYESGIMRLAFVLWWGCELGKDAAARAGDEEALYQLGGIQRDLGEACWAYTRQRSLPAVLERAAPYLREWASHPGGDDYWAGLSAPARAADVPGLFVAGWYDVFMEGTIAAFQRAQADGPPQQRLVIGPWQHVPWARRVGGLDFGPEAVSRIDSWVLDFFDATLLERELAGSAAEAAPVRVFVTGSNRWLDLQAWPPSDATEGVFHLAGERANSSGGDGELSPEPGDREIVERYVVDPWDPARSVGGRSCCDPALTPMGPCDRAEEQQRNDRLVFDSQPLRSATTVVGAPRATFGFSADAASTDIVARLCDVHPGGEAYGVSERAVRLSPPDGVRSLTLTLSPLAVCFEPGHRIRLELSGADFPSRDLNLQAIESEAGSSLTRAQVCTHCIYHGGGHESRLELPLYADGPQATHR